jgi:hypothetical protein
MSEIVFAKPVHQYDSYRDFWTLVTLSGFSTVSVSDIDLTKDIIYITAPMNGDYKEHFYGDLKHYEETGEMIGGELQRRKISGQQRLAHLIVWNLERPAGSGSTGNYAKDCFKWMETRIADEVWISDPMLADETQTRFVLLGSHPGLGELSDKKSYDFCHMSLVNPRRTTIYKHFKDKFRIGPNCWPPERDEVLASSRFALNVHQDNYPFCEPLRFALFAAYGLPIISEILATGHPYNDVVTFSYHDLVAGLKVALNDDYDQWKARGAALHQRLCYDFQFGDIVRKAVSESAGIRWR